jgi:hypothetical protein
MSTPAFEGLLGCRGLVDRQTLVDGLVEGPHVTTNEFGTSVVTRFDTVLCVRHGGEQRVRLLLGHRLACGLDLLGPATRLKFSEEFSLSKFLIHVIYSKSRVEEEDNDVDLHRYLQISIPTPPEAVY